MDGIKFLQELFFNVIMCVSLVVLIFGFMFIVVYKKSDIKICRNISMYELEGLNITLEEFALRIKNEIISQYRYELDKIYNGRLKC